MDSVDLGHDMSRPLAQDRVGEGFNSLECGVLERGDS